MSMVDVSTPSSRTVPEERAPGVIRCSPFRVRTNVVLPQPDGPMMAVTLFFGMRAETSNRT